MLTLNRALSDSLALLLPTACIGCGKVLTGRQEWICVECMGAIPLTYFHHDEANPMTLRLQELCPQVECAAAHFFYVNKGRWRSVIHEIKYRRSWYTAYKMGFWYGTELLESPMYQDVDVVVPIPLHNRRLLVRRYNQSEKIAQGVSKALGCRVNFTAIKRLRSNPSQVTRSRDRRWENVKGLFGVVHPEQLAGRHILLVDDVFTTGATMISCIEAILSSVEGCRISVATLAVSRREIIGVAL